MRPSGGRTWAGIDEPILDVQPVRPRPSRFDGHLGLVSAFIAGALLVAIIKPWGLGVQSSNVARSTPSAPPAPSETPPPELGYESRVYDPSIFGSHEPEAAWAFWPAGFLVTFGFVIQVPGDAGASPGASAVPSGRGAPTPAAASPGAATSPQPGPPSVADDPVWPARFDVPTGNHLLLIGINMPLGHSLASVQLQHASASGSLDAVTVRQLPSPWPSHFAVIGLPTSVADDRLAIWPSGRYRLDMTFDPGQVTRTIEITIGGSSPGQ